MNRKYLIISSFILSFIGGLFDVYCLFYRGGKYAFLQTGNLLNIAIDLLEKNHTNLFLGSFLFISFILGLFVAYLINYWFQKKGKPQYSKLTLLFIMLILVIPNYFFAATKGVDWSYLGIFGLGVIGGILLEAFRVYYVNFTSTMMTNNCKLLVHSFLDGLLYKKNGEVRKSLIYVGIILSFLLGVLVVALINYLDYSPNIVLVIGQLAFMSLIIIEILGIKKEKEIVRNEK